MLFVDVIVVGGCGGAVGHGGSGGGSCWTIFRSFFLLLHNSEGKNGKLCLFFCEEDKILLQEERERGVLLDWGIRKSYRGAAF